MSRNIWVPHTTRHYIERADHGPRAKTNGIVIHTMEGTLSGATNWFENPNAGGVAAHMGIGKGIALQYLPLEKKAWHAVAANYDKIGIEHEGSASYSRHKWLTDCHTELHISANRAAWILHEFDLGAPRHNGNLFGHSYGGAAWGGHHDPGSGFPWDVYLSMCHEAYSGHWGR